MLVLASVRSTWPGRRETGGRQSQDIMQLGSKHQYYWHVIWRETEKRKRSGDVFKNDKDVNWKGCMCDVCEDTFPPCPESVAHNSRREHTSVADRGPEQMEQYLDLPPPAAAERRRNYCWRI